MDIRKIAQGFIGLGIMGVLVSLLVDLLPGANAGVQSAQILGIEIAIVILLAGVWVLLSETAKKIYIGETMRDLFERILNLSVLVWVVTGFMITYILFFMFPMFLNATHRMHYFITYLPDRYPIGNDMIAVLDLAKGWFFEGKSPYSTQFYPPLTYVLFAPLLLVSHYPKIFTFFTFITIVSYTILTFTLPQKIVSKEKMSFVMLFFVTGLVSYGLQFELERGQYNVFTFLLCMLSIYIFHYHPKQRVFAYLLFSLSVQLKLYPAVFIVMLVDDWQNWKRISLRFTGIGIFNFILLFAMGPKIFLEFMGSASTQLTLPGWEWVGNHSIKAFVGNLTNDGAGTLAPNVLNFVQQNSRFISNALLLIVLACIASGILIIHQRKEKGIDSYLLLICTIAALTIPVSNDYTLSILAAPMALFFCRLAEEIKDTRNKFLSILLIISMSFGYASTLIPFKYRPEIMGNVFPMLFIIMIAATLLNLIRSKIPKPSIP